MGHSHRPALAGARKAARASRLRQSEQAVKPHDGPKSTAAHISLDSCNTKITEALPKHLCGRTFAGGCGRAGCGSAGAMARITICAGPSCSSSSAMSRWFSASTSRI